MGKTVPIRDLLTTFIDQLEANQTQFWVVLVMSILSILTTIVFFVAGPWALAAVIPLYQEANAYLDSGVLPPEKEDRIDEIRRFLWPHFLENPQDFQQNGPQDEKKDRSHIAKHPGKHANEKRVKKDHHRRKRPGLKIRHQKTPVPIF